MHFNNFWNTPRKTRIIIEKKGQNFSKNHKGTTLLYKLVVEIQFSIWAIEGQMFDCKSNELADFRIFRKMNIIFLQNMYQLFANVIELLQKIEYVSLLKITFFFFS